MNTKMAQIISSKPMNVRTQCRFGSLGRGIAAIGLMLLSALLPKTASAQEQFQGLCSEIKMEISQQLTLERVGFQATLTITDNDPTDPITGFAANLTFENPALSTNGTVNDSSSLFFVQPPTLQGISAIDGTGVIQPGETATITWFIIPTVNAGGTTPNGTVYNVGGSLGGSLAGVQLPASVLSVIPAPITVYPDAQLQITYFQPRDVIAANPFTLGVVQSPVPFTFGVLVQNVGYGAANSITIASQQPQIVENKQNLLIVAQLLGSRVNDSPLSNADLTVNLGNLQPGQATKGAWDMITTLSGTFLSVSATYTHSSALGGAETSLIKSVNAYLFLHEVLDDQPARDSVRDFLADTTGTLDNIGNLMPDSLWESQGNVFPVIDVTNATVIGSSPVQVTLNSINTDWTYVRVDDPQQAKLPIASVVRSDSKVLNTNNYWTSIHYEPTNNFEHFYLNIFDLVNPGTYTYTVTYGTPPVSTNPPVTELLFAGPSTFTNGVYYVTPATQLYFLSQDVTPVSIFYSLDGAAFAPGYPFTLPTPGVHQITYYATEASGLRETNQTALVALPGVAALGFANFTLPSAPFFAPGAALSVRPSVLPITFQALLDPIPINAEVDIFQGVVGWATVAGIPSSPTASTTASLVIGGQNVDYYSYQLNGGAWSADQPVATPLSLSGLPSGTNVVSVQGRSQYGSYMNPSNAVTASWVVSPSAPPTLVTGAPATPTQSKQAELIVGGTGVAGYSWTVDNSYYFPETPVSTPLVVSNLGVGPHVLSVIGDSSQFSQGTNDPTTVDWTVNPLYGYDQSALVPVQSVDFTNIGSGPITYDWNGKNTAGVIQTPGWYTVRVTLTDPNGDTNFVIGLAQIEGLSGTNVVLAGTVRGPQSPFARGRWAVWQDQSSGNWAVYAQDLTLSNAPIIPVSGNTLSQQNPKTDGRYVVWQARQTNGNWDIFLNDLSGTNGPVAITSTPATDEVSPAIDWPWLVYQARPTGSTTAPWQLYALNLATEQTIHVSPSSADEIAPDVQAGRVVWQDWRDAGPGEVYFQNLENNIFQRITTNTFGQYSPTIYGNWIAWQDNRNGESDIYGFNLLYGHEVRITSGPEDDLQPRLEGPWLIYAEDSLGAGTGNAKLISLPSMISVPVTRTPTLKSSPALADGRAVWQETVSNQSSVVSAALPSLQAVFQNQNTVAVTPGMVANAQNAFGLLALWGSNGVQSVTAYTELLPTVVAQTASISNGVPSGANLNLVAGSFLWIQFNGQQVLDLGVNNSTPLNFAAGANVFGFTGFPDAYTAYQLLLQIGLGNAQSVRMLDAQSGRWRVAQVKAGALAGDDFAIPNVAVLMLTVTNPVNQFVPQAQ